MVPEEERQRLIEMLGIDPLEHSPGMADVCWGGSEEASEDTFNVSIGSSGHASGYHTPRESDGEMMAGIDFDEADFLAMFEAQDDLSPKDVAIVRSYSSSQADMFNTGQTRTEIQYSRHRHREKEATCWCMIS